MPSRLTRPLRALLLAAALAGVTSPAARPAQGPQAAPVARIPLPPIQVEAALAGFYQDHEFEPLWTSADGLLPAGERLAAMLRDAGELGPDLAQALEQARSGDRHWLARADLLLSRAYVAHAGARQQPPAQPSLRYIDTGLAPEPVSARALLDEAAAAPSLERHLVAAARGNPVLDGLIRGLAAYRREWSGLPAMTLRSGGDAAALRERLGVGPNQPLAERLRAFQRWHGLRATGETDAATIAALNRGPAHYERLILANIERARAIPARSGRSLIVDTASARLWMVEDGRLVDSMKVIVGKAGMETPAMAGLIRFAVHNPYWNLPPDLIRERARGAVRRGARAITGERLEVLSDWSPGARRLSPAAVNWRAVAAGRAFVNLRQTPGPENMMGRIKFMMPNDLGVYLHDTPLRDYFSRDDRRISSGCVRLEDAQRLARWLFHGRVPRPDGRPEQRVDLPEPVPVFIAYFTAVPTREGVQFQPDRYGRDSRWLAQLAPTGRLRGVTG